MKSSDYSICLEKMNQAIALMNDQNIDSWLFLTREGSDPAVSLIFGIRSVHQAVILLHRSGDAIAIASASDKGNYEATGLFKQVYMYDAQIDQVLLAILQKYEMKTLGLNISETDHLCDGLTSGQYEWLSKCLGEEKLQSIEVSSESMLKEVRSIKTPKEIKKIKKAIEYTQEIYEAVKEDMQCGMSEIEIGMLFVEELKKKNVTNALGEPFDPPLVCIVRKGLAHRKPAHHLTKPGDIVIVDFSVKYEEYVSDIARTYYFLKEGETKVPDEIQRAFDTAIAAIDASIAELQIGKKGYEVDLAGRRVIEQAGYPTIRHSVGHQIGKATHDGGTILGLQRVPERKEVLGEVQAGEVYAIEPTVIQDDQLPCILVEENVLVTQEGPKVLSERQYELILIPSK